LKLGFVSAILGDYDFEKTIGTAAALGYQCVELACWPRGKADRRYAGVCHLDADDYDPDYVNRYCGEKQVELSALAYYPNCMDGFPEARQANIAHLKKVIAASARLGVNMVTTFIGRDQNKNLEDNLALFGEIWPPIVSYAEELGVRIAIENCPMLFDATQWPGGQNLAATPLIWERMFDVIPSKSFGLNFDPSHCVWQMMDYIQPLYDFKDRIFHTHFKDIKLYREKLAKCGTMAYPLDYMSPKLLGLGDVDWGAYLCALTDIRYNGYACIEVEDRAFEDSEEAVINSLILSKRYIEQFVI